MPIKMPIKPPIKPKSQPLRLQPKLMTQAPQQPENMPGRTLLRQQLTEIRKQAIYRGNNNRPVGGKIVVKSQTVVKKGRVSLNPKAIVQLKNIGVGRILIIVAAGPSVLEIDLKPLVGHHLIDFMCINKPFAPVWPTKFWGFCDHTQYRANKTTWDEYNGIILNSPNVRVHKPNQIMIRTKSGRGFSRDIVHGYHIGRSSTYANLQVAYYMAYKKVYIFGMDMAEVNGKLHHYGQNPDVPNEIRKSRFSKEAEHFMHGANILTPEERQRFVICSSYNNWEFTKYFEKLDHKEAVSKILGYANG